MRRRLLNDNDPYSFSTVEHSVRRSYVLRSHESPLQSSISHGAHMSIFWTVLLLDINLLYYFFCLVSLLSISLTQLDSKKKKITSSIIDIPFRNFNFLSCSFNQLISRENHHNCVSFTGNKNTKGIINYLISLVYYIIQT